MSEDEETRGAASRDDATLPDFLADGLRVLSVGINPSLHAVRAGYPFAFARNRFWPALNASQLIDEQLEPGVAATRRLVEHYGFGFTDVVKRPTPGMKSLRAADYARWLPVLRETIERTGVEWLWFHGMTALRAMCRHAAGHFEPVGLGRQAFELYGAAVFVSPNPSPANARYSLAAITASYDNFAACLTAPRTSSY